MNVHAPEGWGVNTVAKFLGPDVPHQMGGGIGVAVDVAVKTGYPRLGFSERRSSVMLNCC